MSLPTRSNVPERVWDKIKPGLAHIMHRKVTIGREDGLARERTFEIRKKDRHVCHREICRPEIRD